MGQVSLNKFQQLKRLREGKETQGVKVEEFDFLPKMLASLKTSDLQNYFKQKAKEISGKFVE